MVSELFQLKERTIIITGGAGFLGQQHAEAVAEAGANVVIADLKAAQAISVAEDLSKRYGIRSLGLSVDVSNPSSVNKMTKATLRMFGRIDGLVNNAAIDAKVDSRQGRKFTRLENFSLEQWNREISVGLTGAFLCSQSVGNVMARQNHGIILNIASDLSVIAPDQRLYKRKNLPPHRQPVKPVTYSVLKAGLIGLTRYLATYWADQGVHVNALSPGGMQKDQPPDFVKKLSNHIPMGRMAKPGEYKAAVLFLISDASSYMNGANIIIDGGRSVW